MPKLVATIAINNVDKTSILLPAIVNLTIDDRFDQDLKPQQLSITFLSNLSYKFNYGDKINVSLKWDNAATTFHSDSFYIDFIQDNVRSSGSTFDISAVGQDTKYNLVVNNNTNNLALKPYDPLMAGFMTNLGISDSVIPTFQNGSTMVFGRESSPSSNDGFPGGSSIDFIEKVCKLLGCVAKISAGKFRMYRLDQLGNLANVQTINLTDLCLSIDFNPKITTFANKYVGIYIASKNTSAANEQDWSWSLGYHEITKNLPGNNKTFYINSESDVIYNQISAPAQVEGVYWNHYFENLIMAMSFIGQPSLYAGIKFTLGSNFGRFARSYFASKVVHKVTGNSWKTDIECIPIGYTVGTDYTTGLLSGSTVTDPGGGVIVDPEDNTGGGTVTPPINPATPNLVIGKYIDLRTYPIDKVASRYNDMTLDRVVTWIMSNTIFSGYPMTYNETQLREVLTPFYNDCVANDLRYDIGIAMLVEITRGFTLPRNDTTKNAFALGSAVTGGTLQTFAEWGHGGNAAAQRLTRVSTTRGYAGTPRDTQVTGFAQNSSPTLYGLDTAYSSVVTDSYITDTLKKMYIQMGLATSNVSIQT